MSDAVTFIALYGASPEDFLNEDDGPRGSDARKLANHTHRFIHESLGNQVSGVSVVVNPDLHARLESAWDQGGDRDRDVFVVVAHPEDTTSYVVDVFCDAETAEEAKDGHEERTGNTCQIEQHQVEA